MGKWATYLRRGTSSQTGTLAPLVVGDWSTAVISNSQINATRVALLPAGADGVRARARPAAGGAFVLGNVAVTTSNITGLAAATLYQIQIAWFNAGIQVSDWSDVKTATTL